MKNNKIAIGHRRCLLRNHEMSEIMQWAIKSTQKEKKQKEGKADIKINQNLI